MRKMNAAKIHVLFLAKIIFVALIVVKSSALYSQVPGCKDPEASNYNVAATQNDGSCMYTTTFYTPPVKVDPLNAVLNESSGLQMAGNFLWSFNDGGGAAAIYRIDTLTNTLLQTVNLGGASNVDWEDIAFDGTNFYIGDFGNNADGARTDLKIYKFPLSAIPADYNANPSVTVSSGQIAIINFTYSDQGTPVATSSNNTKFDCEAMIIDNGQIHLFTKDWIDVNTTHYVINGLIAGTYIATPVDTLATNYLVTAADKAPGHNLVALLGYQVTGFGNHFMHLLSDYSGGKYFNGNKRRIDLPNATIMGQAEGLAFRNDTYGYISNEKLVSITQKLRSFDISTFVPLYVLPLSLKDFTVNTENGTNKIAWSFEGTVQNLQVEYSGNGVNFSVLKTYNNSLKDVFYNKALNPLNYYRISWQINNAARQYSNIITARNDVQFAISNLSLKADGKLTFLLSGNSPGIYSFKLLSSDGKLLAQTKQQSYAPGSNRMFISKKPILNNFVYLTVYGDKQETTTFLRVEK